MPEKNIQNPVRKTASDGNLKLIGDKIKLETRPSGRDSRASSKCSMLSLGPSRPVSAVPLLSLYDKEDYDAGFKTRRPVSAPFDSKLNRRQNSTSLQSIDEIDGNLPSTDLLKTLLSEPIISWRNKKEEVIKNSEKTKEDGLNLSESDLDALSIRSCMSSSSEQSLGTKIQDVAQNGFVKSQSHVENIQENGILTPGLTGKPPIPRKKDEKALIKTYSTYKNDYFVNKNCANYTDDLKDSMHFDYSDRNSSRENLEDIEKIYDYSNTKIDIINDNTSDYESRESSTESEKNDEKTDNDNRIQYQNWIFEETEREKREKKTDLYLKSLKKQNDEIQQLIRESELVLQNDNKKELKEIVKFDAFFRKDETRTQNENEISKNSTKIKPKIDVTKKQPKSTKVPNFNIIKKSIEGKSKQKFTPTPMRHYKEYKENEITEVESWMTNRNDTNELKLNENVKINTKADYSEVLDSVKELEEVVKVDKQIDSLEDVPEQDDDDEPDDEEEVEDQQGYDEITSILEVLEAQDKKSQKKMESIKEIVNIELAKNVAQQTKNKTKLQKNSPPPIMKETKKVLLLPEKVIKPITTEKECNSLNSSANYNNILTFLEEVEKNSCKTLTCAKERVNSVTKLLETSINLDTIPKIEDLLSHSNEELSNQIIDLTLRLKDKSSSIKLLQDELSTLREQIMKMTKQTDEIVKFKLKAQKDEFESIVKRHQKFIDQLIDDKKSLNQQCEGLLNEIKLLEDRHNSNLKAMEHKHKVELQKVKDMQIAGEKIRRERWIDNKTQKIKEMTVKSIEPELQNMNSRHQQEIADLRTLHKREIEDLELKAARKTQQQCELLREQLAMEREKAIAHEREIIRQRYESMVESEEKSYQDQRRRLQQEHANRLNECEERELLAINEKDRAIKQAQDEFEDKLQTVLRRHSNEIKVLKEKTELEMEAWKNHFMKQQNLQLTEKEVQIREHYRKERDREIENVIERLENEASETKAQIEQTTENRIRRLKEKYENEMRDFEITEKESKSKYNDIKTKLLESENVIINLQITIKQLELHLKESQEISRQLSEDKSQMKEIVREEVKEELEKMAKEIQILKEEKEKEMQQVYSRVRVTVARKDELLAELTRDHGALQEKCSYLESMLQQQRKDYLMK